MFRQDSTCPALLVVYSVPSMIFRIHGYHALWLTFPGYSPKSSNIIYRLIRVRSPLLAESRLISFPRGTQMVQFSRFASLQLCIHCRIPVQLNCLTLSPIYAFFLLPYMAFRCFAPESSLIGQVGFPIRISLDHSSFANSPTLFAGLHVLLRLSSPRHPPDALIHLTLSFEVPLTSWLGR